MSNDPANPKLLPPLSMRAASPIPSDTPASRAFADAQARTRPLAFTLVELLCVISVIVLLAALTLPALQRLGAANLSTSGPKFSGILEMARQTAITTRQPVAVVLLRQRGDEPLRVTCLRYDASQSAGATRWRQFSGWESFTGLVADNRDSRGNLLTGFTQDDSPKLGSTEVNEETGEVDEDSARDTLPALRYSGRDHTDYGYIVFRPDGSLYRSEGKPSLPCLVRLVLGSRDAAGAEVVYRGARDAENRPANYYEIIVTDATGQIKTNRP